ncbi:MAG: hypothetical protein IT529_23210 [Burkholderiales bacterium]|nr:hypothetical protein [Burkholderiales bacterium]
MAVYGAKMGEDFLACGPRLLLPARGFRDQPSAPLLLVSAEKDTQQPIAELYVLTRHGDPEDVWVGPWGGHDGRSEKRRVVESSSGS